MHHRLPSEDSTMHTHHSTLPAQGTPHTFTPPAPRWADATTCPACGSGRPDALGPSAGPWHAQLICRCGQHVRWASKYQSTLSAAMNQLREGAMA